MSDADRPAGTPGDDQIDDIGRDADGHIDHDEVDDADHDEVDEAADARARDDDATAFSVDESAWQRAEDEALADRRVSSIEAGRRKGGVMGAAMAGAMLAIQEIYEGPPKDDGAIEIEAPGEPGDIDEDGILVNVGGVDVEAKLPDAPSR